MSRPEFPFFTSRWRNLPDQEEVPLIEISQPTSTMKTSSFNNTMAPFNLEPYYQRLYQWPNSALDITYKYKGPLSTIKDSLISITERHGKGSLISLCGQRKYEGDFIHDKITGKGTYSWAASGNKYEGDWLDGKRTGKGVLTWANGDEFKGTFLNNAPVIGAFPT